MRKYIAIVAAVGAIAAVAAPVSGASNKYTMPKPCKVPKVVGKALGAAETAITGANCKVGSVATKTSTAPKGNVISQSPTSGSGPTVNLTVSLGKPAPGAKCTVPNVVGKSQASASQALVKANCGVGKVTTTKSKATKGSVVSTSPAAGKTGPVGLKVDLALSSGPAKKKK